MDILEYKQKYFDNNICPPGEHHFVAVYLLNKFKRIPDYINPDGMKGKCGDVIFENKDKSFCIEVKIGKTSFSFSKSENNSWFVYKKSTFPSYLIALTNNYLFIIKWNDFSDVFIRLKNPQIINSKSGNSRRISEKELKDNLKNDSVFDLNSPNVENEIEKKFKTINKEIENVYK